MKRTVLVVDDDDGIRETLREILEDEGYAVAEAANGQEGLDRLRAGPRPALVLLDLMMPVVSGLDFLRAVKADPQLASVPILVLSAAAKESAEEAMRLSVAKGVLAKPVELSVLLRAVETHS